MAQIPTKKGDYPIPKRLTAAQWTALDAQLAVTPNPTTAPPGEGSQHWLLAAPLNDLGCYPAFDAPAIPLDFTGFPKCL